MGAEPISDEDLAEIRAGLEGSASLPRKDPFAIQSAALYGGITNVKLADGVFEIAPGLNISSTYAHVMAPFLVAFAPPPSQRVPHPGPLAALGERGLTITAQIELLAAAEPLGGFDRLNDLWFTVAMLRLRTERPVQMPVLSDRPFSLVANSVRSANLIAVEIDLSRPRASNVGGLTTHDLAWVKHSIRPAAKLMQEPEFNRAFQTLDRAHAIPNAGAGIVIAWAAIETLLRPGSNRITQRLCRSLAALLEAPGPRRDRAFADIVSAYEARGGAAHAGLMPEAKQFLMAFRLARAAISRAIENRALPDIDELLIRWEQRR